MSSATQVDLDWGGVDSTQGEGGAPRVSAPGAVGSGAGTGAYLSDEEILGIEPPSPQGGFGGLARLDGGSDRTLSGLNDAVAPGGNGAGPGNQPAGGAGASGQTAAAAMPAWMAALAADPKAGAEARALWSEHQALRTEHQAFRATFSSPEEARVVADEARAIKEMFPGGAREAQALKQGTESLREAAQSVDRIDAAIFSGDPRAQSEVVVELARANPAAFRSLVAEANRVVERMGANGSTDHSESGQEPRAQSAAPTLRENREGRGTFYNSVGVVKRHFCI